jgi:hypothetical protein
MLSGSLLLMRLAQNLPNGQFFPRTDAELDFCNQLNFKTYRITWVEIAAVGLVSNDANAFNG